MRIYLKALRYSKYLTLPKKKNLIKFYLEKRSEINNMQYDLLLPLSEQ